VVVALSTRGINLMDSNRHSLSAGARGRMYSVVQGREDT
jgi:hypothetical protein